MGFLLKLLSINSVVLSEKSYLFFANFGDWSKIPFGGGEVGNRRTLALLKKLNYDIVLIPKYIRVNDHSLINSIELLFKIISNIFCLQRL